MWLLPAKNWPQLLEVSIVHLTAAALVSSACQGLGNKISIKMAL